MASVAVEKVDDCRCAADFGGVVYDALTDAESKVRTQIKIGNRETAQAKEHFTLLIGSVYCLPSTASPLWHRHERREIAVVLSRPILEENAHLRPWRHEDCERGLQSRQHAL